MTELLEIIHDLIAFEGLDTLLILIVHKKCRVIWTICEGKMRQSLLPFQAYECPVANRQGSTHMFG